MCENFGLIILNGRTKGDCAGEFTFLSKMGASVIDFAITSIHCLEKVVDFRIVEHIGSDHMPTELTIRMRSQNEGRGEEFVLPLLPRLKWTNSDSLHFKEIINIEASNLNLTQNDATNVENIITCIRNAACLKQIKASNNKNVQKLNRKQPWFDYHCFNSRRKVFKLLNLFRKTNSKLLKEQYLQASKVFKQLIKTKKKVYFESLYVTLREAKDGKTLWKAINSFKLKGANITGRVTISEWVIHFKQLLNPPLLSGSMCYAQPLIIDNSLDCDFSFIELKTVLAKTKNGKAPGADGIPYEFLKIALTHLFKSYWFFIIQFSKIQKCRIVLRTQSSIHYSKRGTRITLKTIADYLLLTA